MPQETATTSENRGLLKATATAVGSAVGKVAALATSVLPHKHPAPSTTALKVNGRFSKKNKARLPRRVKKALAKKNSKVVL
jgi:hypothetical protein